MRNFVNPVGRGTNLRQWLLPSFLLRHSPKSQFKLLIGSGRVLKYQTTRPLIRLLSCFSCFCVPVKSRITLSDCKFLLTVRTITYRLLASEAAESNSLFDVAKKEVITT